MFTRLWCKLSPYLLPAAHNRAKLTPKMNTFNVRNIPGEERLQMSFCFGLEAGKSREFNFDRPKSELVGVTLGRIKNSVVSKTVNKKKRKQGEGIDIDSKLFKGTEKVKGDSLNEEAFIQNNSVHIGDCQYKVEVNLPTVRTVILPKCIMSGYPVSPKLDAEFVNLEDCEYAWYKARCDIESSEKSEESCSATGKSDSKKTPKNKNPGKMNSDELKDLPWELIHSGTHYMPTNQDIGFLIKVVCTPKNGDRTGEKKGFVSKHEVTAGPGFCPFENSHLYTEKEANAGSFRMVSYNILADVYADSDFSRDYLFPYCPPYALELDYRKQLLMKELSGYKADIICLQEVDKKLFERDLLPTFDLAGYEGLLCLKGGQVLEGMATFYRKSKFRCVGQENITLRDVMSTDPEYKDLKEKVESKEDLKTNWNDRATTLQVTVLEDVLSGRLLVAGTTHLYFHPKADHIRVIQGIMCLRHLTKVVEKYNKQAEHRPAVMLCGDLNTSPRSGLSDLLRQKTISSKHKDWYSGGKAEFVDWMELSHDLDLISACGYPDYTNYVARFSGCLDYIYIDSNQLTTERVIPLPLHEEVTQYTALPNAVFPSDHLALVCDIKWNESTKSAVNE